MDVCAKRLSVWFRSVSGLGAVVLCSSALLSKSILSTSREQLIWSDLAIAWD